MKMKLGSNTFDDVNIPLLWGTRAVIVHDDGSLSVVDLSGEKASIEVLKDQPAKNVDFRPIDGGYEITEEGGDVLYEFYDSEHKLKDPSNRLQDCEITESGIKVGSSHFQDNSMSGFGVGIIVGENSMAMGAPLPEGLADLIV